MRVSWDRVPVERGVDAIRAARAHEEPEARRAPNPRVSFLRHGDALAVPQAVPRTKQARGRGQESEIAAPPAVPAGGAPQQGPLPYDV